MLTAWRRDLTCSSYWCWKATHAIFSLPGCFSERNVSLLYSQPLQATHPFLLKQPHQSVPVPVWTAPASDGQLEPDSTPNHFFNMFTKDN